MYDVIFWGVVFVVMIALETFTTQLVSIWFAAGSLVSFITAFFVKNLPIQIVVFLIVSIVLLIFTRPIVRKIKNGPPTPTNADAIVGKDGVVTVEIDNVKNSGRAKIDGLSWSVKSVDNSVIPEGSVVEVIEIKGVAAYVKLK